MEDKSVASAQEIVVLSADKSTIPAPFHGLEITPNKSIAQETIPQFSSISRGTLCLCGTPYERYH